MKIKIDKDKCLGCGTCVAMAPEVFEIGEDGKSKVKEGAELEKNKDLIIQAKDGCRLKRLRLKKKIK
jgi:ferredoxin